MASDGAADDFFGRSVSLSGDTALVAAEDDDIGMNTDQGSAYVFVRNGTTWTQQAKFVASDGAVNDYFGQSVAVSGDTALVGAYHHAIGANMNQGSVYVFVRNGTTWTQQAQLISSDGKMGDLFGASVALLGDRALVGAYLDYSPGNPYSGSAYVFERSGTTWTEQAILAVNDGVMGTYFGWSVSLSGDTALLGTWSSEGTAYVYVVPKANGNVCANAAECTSGFCVNGVCCESACGGTCQACSVAMGAPVDGTCTLLAAGTECRASAGACDKTEQCDGIMNDCPLDAKLDPGTECRTSAGACDIAERCDGADNDCPTDAKAVDGSICPEGTCTSGACVVGGGMGGAGGNGDGGSASQGEASSSSSGGATIGNEGCDCRIATTSNGSSQFALVMAALCVALVRRRAAIPHRSDPPGS